MLERSYPDLPGKNQGSLNVVNTLPCSLVIYSPFSNTHVLEAAKLLRQLLPIISQKSFCQFASSLSKRNLLILISNRLKFVNTFIHNVRTVLPNTQMLSSDGPYGIILRHCSLVSSVVHLSCNKSFILCRIENLRCHNRSRYWLTIDAPTLCGSTHFSKEHFEVATILEESQARKPGSHGGQAFTSPPFRRIPTSSASMSSARSRAL